MQKAREDFNIEFRLKLQNEFSRRARINEPYSVRAFTHHLGIDTFAVISDWYHFAILDLMLLKNFKSDHQWISRKLSIQDHEAKIALERLKRLHLLIEKNGKLVKTNEFYTNYSEGTTAAALKEYQRQVIKKALYVVDNCDQDRKDITSITIAADSKKLKQAKEK